MALGGQQKSLMGAGAANPAAIPPPVYWTMLGAAVWIVTRSLEAVGEVEAKLVHWSDYRGQTAAVVWMQGSQAVVERYCSCLNSPCDCVESAVAELVENLQRGRLSAFGIRTLDDELDVIRPEQFAYARVAFSSVDGLRLLRNFRLVHVRREQVIAQWPSPTDTRGPDKKLVVTATSKAVLECVEWLKSELANPSNHRLRRDEFKRRAVSDVFPGRLSGRAFKTAWEQASVGFPEFRKPGPRRT